MTAEDIQDEWRDEAACVAEIKKKPYMLGAWDGANEDGVRHPYVETAVNICIKECRVRNICLQGALDNEEAQGLRGGYEFDSGRLPVAVAREIRDTMGLTIAEWQSTGRPKK